MPVFSEKQLNEILKENEDGIFKDIKKNADGIKSGIDNTISSAKDNFNKNKSKISDNINNAKEKIEKLKPRKTLKVSIPKEEGGDCDGCLEEKSDDVIKIGKKIFRPLTKQEEKEKGLAFKDAINIQGKKYVYKMEDDVRDVTRNPLGAGSKTAGKVFGATVGGAVAGAPGSAIGSAVGSATGEILGKSISSTKIGSSIEKPYHKTIDNVYKSIGKSKPKSKKENFDFRNVYRSKEYSMAIEEYFDITHDETRKILLSINENDQNRVLVSLTSKLYDNIVDKVDDIDFGEIPSTKGDITKLSNYPKLNECVDIMSKLLVEFKQDTSPVDSIRTAINNMIESTSLWKRGFAINAELPMVTYNTIVLSIIEATTYLISMCVEFIKIPSQDSFQVQIDKSALSKTKGHLIFDNINKFNEAYKKNQIQNAMEYIIKNNSKNLMGELTGGTAIFGIVALLFTIIPILRELIFLFYYNRVRISEYFDAQADMLQVNAYNIEHNRLDLSKEQKKEITKKQIKIAERFKAVANAVSIKMKESEIKATKDLTNQNKKYKVDEVLDELPDSASSVLF